MKYSAKNSIKKYKLAPATFLVDSNDCAT